VHDRRQSHSSQGPADTIECDDPAVLQRVLDRYRANKRIIEAVAESFGTTAVVVWQPVPTYHHEDTGLSKS